MLILEIVSLIIWIAAEMRDAPEQLSGWDGAGGGVGRSSSKAVFAVDTQ